MSRTNRQPRLQDYTEAEREVLRAHYANAARETILAGCPGRTWKSLRQQAIHLRLTRARPTTWSPAAVAALQAHYPSGGTKAVQDVTGHSATSIQQKAWEMGIACERRGPRPRTEAPAVVARKRAAAKATRKRGARVKAKAAPKPKPAKPVREAPAQKPMPLPGIQENSRTPVLNAQKTAQLAKKKQEAEKPKGYVSADMVRALPPTHPARQAYTFAAHRGMDAAQAAYHQAMSTFKQAA